MDVDTGPDIPNGRDKIIVDHCKLVHQALLAFAKMKIIFHLITQKNNKLGRIFKDCVMKIYFL